MYNKESIDQIMKGNEIILEVNLDTESEKENRNNSNLQQGISSEKQDNIHDKTEL